MHACSSGQHIHNFIHLKLPKEASGEAVMKLPSSQITQANRSLPMDQNIYKRSDWNDIKLKKRILYC